MAGSIPDADVRGYTQLRTYRYERKFVIEEMRPFQVQGIIKLHPAMFVIPNQSRYVNNLYLDTPDLDNYYDNVNGSKQRRKVRVRWYGEPFGEIKHPMLEIKVKNGTVGTKNSYPFPSFNLDRNFCDRYFRQIASDSGLPESVWRDLRNLNVVLFNRYHRGYYLSQGGRFRLTLDHEMTFYKINGVFGNMFAHRQVNYRDIVLELKYEVADESRAYRVVSSFPFRIARNSKYVQGMERVYF